MLADNLKLESVGNVLDVQLYARNGTYVSSNERLCFDASQQWTRRSDSVITYELDKVMHSGHFEHHILMYVAVLGAEVSPIRSERTVHICV